MSTITWQGDTLIQRVSSLGMQDELGYVARDDHSGKYILWLKDTKRVFGPNGGYIPGDEFASMADAKQHAAGCATARIFHHLWMARQAELPVSVPEARTIVIQTVENMQLNQNSLGVQVANSDVALVKERIEQAEPSLLAKIFKEWLPSACTAIGLGALIKLLGA